MKKKILILGTSSNVGKSIIVTGLCKLFSDKGLSVYPFKAQNMSANSYKTEDGYEMGMAQAIQAEACGKTPDFRMNPILLKPNRNATSTVIVNGKEFTTTSAKEYHELNGILKKEILKSYEALSETADMIVLEGAGGAAEINLREVDLSNMGMAKISNAPVIIVGDIERGGVFASLYGTYMLFTEEEKKYVKGFIINKFRGDVSLLKSGIDELTKLTGVPVLGVIPYGDFDIEEEDMPSNKPKTRTNGLAEDGKAYRMKQYDKVKELLISNLNINLLTKIAKGEC